MKKKPAKFEVNYKATDPKSSKSTIKINMRKIITSLHALLMPCLTIIFILKYQLKIGNVYYLKVSLDYDAMYSLLCNSDSWLSQACNQGVIRPAVISQFEWRWVLSKVHSHRY